MNISELLNLADGAINAYGSFTEQMPTCEADLLGPDGMAAVNAYWEKTRALRTDADELDTQPSPSVLTFSEYAAEVLQYGVYPESHKVVYPALGLAGEAGETADCIKKAIRDDECRLTDDRKRKALLEAGDALWYIAALARDLGSSLEEVAQMNREKLAARNAKGKIHGEGSER